jgi:hypothetical protein
MIPAKLIVIVLAMFVIASFGAITPTVLAAQHERQQQEQGQQQPPAQAQTNNTTAHARTDNTTAHARTDNTTAHARTDNTTALSSQSPPQPSCPGGVDDTYPGTASVPGFNNPRILYLTNTDICVIMASVPPQNGQCPTGFNLSDGTPPVCWAAVLTYQLCPEGYSFNPQTNECLQQTQTQTQTQPLR